MYLLGLLLVASTALAWAVILIGSSAPWASPGRPIITLFSLIGITVAIQRLLRGQRNAWLMSAALAGNLVIVTLVIAKWLSDRA